MRVVPLNEVKNRLSMYLELSRREDIVVTKNGRAAAVLHGITWTWAAPVGSSCSSPGRSRGPPPGDSRPA